MADQDTDRWILEVLAPDLRRKMKTLKNEIQWTDLVYVFRAHLFLDVLSRILEVLSLSEKHTPEVSRRTRSFTHFESCLTLVSSSPVFHARLTTWFTQHPAMVRAVKKLKEGGNTTFLCLSNANSVFISTILEDKGLTTLFDEIITNPAEWESSGLLNLKRKIDPEGPQHCCQVGCSPNLCKGSGDFILPSESVKSQKIHRRRTGCIPSTQGHTI